MRALLVCIAVLFSQCATAAVTINIYETNGNVQADMSGNVNLSATGGFAGLSGAYNGYLASSGGIAFTNGSTEFYNIDVGTWTPFGPGGFGTWDSASGDALALFTDPVIGVPTGYVSGNALSATATKNTTTLAVLGFTTGTYVTTLTNGLTTDTITVIVGGAPPEPVAPAVPVPSLQIWALITLAVLLGFFGMSARTSRSKR